MVEQVTFNQEGLEHLDLYIPHTILSYTKIFCVFINGYACARGSVEDHGNGTWYFASDLVIELFRGRGFQRALIRARLEYIKTQGALKATVLIKEGNEFSLRNYLAEGFIVQPNNGWTTNIIALYKDLT